MSQTEGQDAAGNLVYHPNVLAVQPLTVTQDYNLEADDPNIYTDGEDMDSFYPRRESTDKNLPATSSSVTSSQAADQAEMIQLLLKVNHVHTGIQKPLEVDPCKEYKQSRVENVLTRVLPGLRNVVFATGSFAKLRD